MFETVIGLCLLALCSCAHRISVDSVPPDAKVYSIDSSGARKELLGKTPLSIDGVKGSGLYGIEVEQPGYMPHKLVFPLAYASDVRVRIDLQKLSDDFVRNLPPALFRTGVDRALEELLYLQSSLYTKSDDEIARMLMDYDKRYSEVSAYHFLVGTFNLYKSRYSEASRAFSKAIELDPKNEDARKMLILTDVKFVNQSQALRSRAFADIEASAKEVAALSNGYVAKVKINPNSPTYDGFEIVIPSDVLFRPTTARVTPRGASVLNKLSKEFLKVQQGLSVTIEAHTDPDVSAEANENPGFVSKGKSPFKSAWELSSARAASVMELLKAEGVNAETWSIAGYADSRPLLYKPVGKNEPVVNQNMNRRVVLRVSLLPKERNETVLSEDEVKQLKARAAQFLDEGQNGEEGNSRGNSGNAGRNSRSNDFGNNSQNSNQNIRNSGGGFQQGQNFNPYQNQGGNISPYDVQMNGEVNANGNVGLSGNGSRAGGGNTSGTNTRGANGQVGGRNTAPSRGVTRVNGGNVSASSKGAGKGSSGSVKGSTGKTDKKKSVPIPKIPKIALPHQ